MPARRFIRSQDALRRESAQEVLRAGGLEDRKDLDGGGKDCGREGTETEAETESWGQVIVNMTLNSNIQNSVTVQ